MDIDYALIKPLAYYQEVGEFNVEPSPHVILICKTGGYRVVNMLAGEQLPRIC